MKVFVYAVLSSICLITGIENTTIMQPVSTADTPWPTRSSRQTFATSVSTSLSNTTAADDGFWSNRSNYIQLIIGIVVLTVVTGFLTVAVKNLCSNKKHRRLVVENKYHLATISGKREDAPPAYADIHRVWSVIGLLSISEKLIFDHDWERKEEKRNEYWFVSDVIRYECSDDEQ